MSRNNHQSIGSAESLPGPEPDQENRLALLRLPDRRGRYLPIGDYAVIGDTRTMALVGRDGSIDWLCLPNVDSPSTFAALLDRDRGGHFFVGVSQPTETIRWYSDASAVLITLFRTAEGAVQLTDFMPMPLRDIEGQLQPARRIIRIVQAIEGNPQVAVHVAPRPNYAETVPDLRPAGRSSWVAADGQTFLLLQSEIPLVAGRDGTLIGDFRLRAGDTRRLSLSYCRNSPGVVPAMGHTCEEALEKTECFWREFCHRIHYDGPFPDAVTRSIVTLRLLTFSHSGAVVAAATSSLPEAIGGSRNWDYRFCWLRDSYFVLQSFMAVGLKEEGDAFFRWLMQATQLTAPHLQNLYTVYGRTDVKPYRLKTLEGYRHSAPVHRGNGAEGQLQLDTYGAMLVSAAVLIQHGGHIDRGELRRLRGFADVVRKEWTLPDNGLWEMRGGRKHTTYSKLMCWAGLDAIVRLAESGVTTLDVLRYACEREVIRETIMREAWNQDRRAFTGAFGHDFLDASLLLMPRLGFIAADDPRMVATFDAIENSLGRWPRMRRYRDRLDGFSCKEGAFTACGFWAGDYLARRGDIDGARRRISAMIETGSDLRLFSEEGDPDTGEQLGNFPQGLSHAALIGAALALREAEQAAAL